MARRCTTAYARSRRTRRRFNLMMLGLVVTLTGVAAPSLMASASSNFDRLVVAEAQGDTADAIARKISREISYDSKIPTTLTVVQASTGGCIVVEVGARVECETDVRIKHLADGSYKVIAKRHGERAAFTGKAL